MNETTLKQFPKTFEEIKERINVSMDSCTNLEQLSATLDFNNVYIKEISKRESSKFTRQ